MKVGDNVRVISSGEPKPIKVNTIGSIIKINSDGITISEFITNKEIDLINGIDEFEVLKQIFYFDTFCDTDTKDLKGEYLNWISVEDDILYNTGKQYDFDELPEKDKDLLSNLIKKGCIELYDPKPDDYDFDVLGGESYYYIYEGSDVYVTFSKYDVETYPIDKVVIVNK